jgi:imidazolonepropionase-like amidohydrolase
MGRLRTPSLPRLRSLARLPPAAAVGSHDTPRRGTRLRRAVALSAWPAAAVLLLIAAVPSAVPAQTIAITGGKVFPVSGPPIDGGTVVITDGKITAVGANVAVPPAATRIDASGKWVTPGLISAASRLGLVEVGQAQDTNDATARGQDAVAAAFRAWEGLNTTTVLWAAARNEGVTSVVALPSGGLLSGQAALVDLADGPLSRLLRKAPAAMVGQVVSTRAANASARGELFLRLRELLDDARAYAARREAFERGATRGFGTGRLHLEALGPVVGGALPLVLAVDRASDIEAAIDLAAEHGVHLIVLGGAEAWMVADRLAAAKVPVITVALDNIPRFGSLGSRQENAALLQKAGVKVAIVSGAGESFNVRNIRQHAGNAVAYGLPWDEALRAVTLSPAEIFDVQAAVGSIQDGRDANIVVWSGDPFEFATEAEHVFVQGRDVRAASRQDELTARYKAGRLTIGGAPVVVAGPPPGDPTCGPEEMEDLLGAAALECWVREGDLIWRLRSALSAYRAGAIKVDVPDDALVRDVGLRMVEVGRERYNEVVVYVYPPRGRGSQSVFRLQWTPQTGTREMTFEVEPPL